MQALAVGGLEEGIREDARKEREGGSGGSGGGKRGCSEEQTGEAAKTLPV